MRNNINLVRRTGRTGTETVVKVAQIRPRGCRPCPAYKPPVGQPVRRAARRLVDAGAGEITQKSRVVDPSTARGPIRIRLPR